MRAVGEMVGGEQNASLCSKRLERDDPDAQRNCGRSARARGHRPLLGHVQAERLYTPSISPKAAESSRILSNEAKRGAGASCAPSWRRGPSRRRRPQTRSTSGARGRAAGTKSCTRSQPAAAPCVSGAVSQRVESRSLIPRRGVLSLFYQGGAENPSSVVDSRSNIYGAGAAGRGGAGRVEEPSPR